MSGWIYILFLFVAIGLVVLNVTYSNRALFFVSIFIGFLMLLFVYYNLTTTSTSISSGVINLNQGQGGGTVAITSSPSSTTFSYSFWVYVNSWNDGANKMLLSQCDSSNNTLFNIELGTSQLTLAVKVKNNSPPVIGTRNFPLQKWTNVVVNVDQNVVDVFIDGKMTSSAKLQTSMATNSANIVYGSGVDILLSNITRDTSIASPGQVWWRYQKEANLYFSIFNQNLNMNVQVIDNNTTSTYALL
jgi:hypothetical protein